MLDRLRSLITWPIAAVLIAGGILFAAILIFAPADVRELLIGANGLLWAFIAGHLKPPGNGSKPSGGSGLGAPMLALVLALGALSSGCGASALERHATAAHVLHGAGNIAAVTITEATEVASTLAAAPCLPGARDRQPVETCDAELERIRERAHTWQASQHAAAEAIDLYREVVLQVAAGVDVAKTMLATYGLRALALLGAVFDALEAAGVNVPEIPGLDLLRGLLGDGGGT